ncbi:hypothetical protein [Streptomyces sp. NBC_00035]|uniref:hypothetical protein n=1 Tax=Streptomyces sp. NBC_00035 TaxID=2903614 RepID=UPI00324A0252
MAEPTAWEEERLRAALALIGDAAAGPDPAAPPGRPDPATPPAPSASPSRIRRPEGASHRRGRRQALIDGAVAAAVLCAALLTNDSWFRDTQSGTAADPSGSSGRVEDGAEDGQDEDGVGQTYAEGIACARLIVEGDVLDVRPAPRTGRVLLTFAVADWIKPGRGRSTIELDLVDPTVAEVEEPFGKGQHLLLVVPVREDLEADASRGTELTRMREIIDSNWAEAARTECPPYWKGTQS